MKKITCTYTKCLLFYLVLYSLVTNVVSVYRSKSGILDFAAGGGIIYNIVNHCTFTCPNTDHHKFLYFYIFFVLADKIAGPGPNLSGKVLQCVYGIVVMHIMCMC